MGRDLLVEIGYLEPIHIRRSGDPRLLAVGPSSYAKSSLHIPPSTILGALATAMMDLGLLDALSKEDLRAYRALEGRLGLRVTGPPYIYCKKPRDQSGDGYEEIYLLTANGPLEIGTLYREITYIASSIGDADKALRELWRALTQRLKNTGGGPLWERELVRVSLEDPVRRAREGYLFSRSLLAMGRVFMKGSMRCRIYLPISADQEDSEKLRDLMGRGVPVRLGGSSRIASLGISKGPDPLRIYMERLWRAGEEYIGFIAILASPMPGPCDCYREEVAKAFEKLVEALLNRSRCFGGECRARGSFVHIDQQPEGWSLAAQRRRPYRAWVLPGSSLLVASCSIEYFKAEELLYAGGYAWLVEEIVREVWEDVAGKSGEKEDQDRRVASGIRDLVEEGFGRFVLLPIPI